MTAHTVSTMDSRGADPDTMKRRLLVNAAPWLMVLMAVATAWCVRVARLNASLDQLREVGDRYGVTIVIPEEAFTVQTSWQVTGKAASPRQLDRYALLLASELTLYPPHFLSTAVEEIVLCGDLALGDAERGGIPDYLSRTLYINVGYGAYHRKYQRRAFHHELFHLVDHLDDGSYSDVRWKDLNPAEVRYGAGGEAFHRTHDYAPMYAKLSGFFSEYAATGIEEDKAEVFATMMVDPRLVERRAEEDPVIWGKVAMMKELLLGFSGEMDAKFWARHSERSSQRRFIWRVLLGAGLGMVIATVVALLAGRSLVTAVRGAAGPSGRPPYNPPRASLTDR